METEPEQGKDVEPVAVGLRGKQAIVIRDLKKDFWGDHCHTRPQRGRWLLRFWASGYFFFLRQIHPVQHADRYVLLHIGLCRHIWLRHLRP
jgi:hypothetical protein